MHSERNKTWIVLGTGPSHRYWYEYLLKTLIFWTTITANDGIDVCTAPDYYWLSDPNAWRKHRGRTRTLQKRNVKLVTSEHLPAIAPRADVCLDVPVKFPPEIRPFEPGRYVNGRTSGSIMVQFAVNSGAQHVHIVGCEGWHRGPKSRITDEYYAPLMRSVVAACPNVQFTFYGSLAYDISGDNVRIIESVSPDVLHA